jgi:hypothetical protein
VDSGVCLNEPLQGFGTPSMHTSARAHPISLDTGLG